MGAISNICDNISSLNNSTVSEFLQNGTWNESIIRQNVPPILVPDILQTSFHYNPENTDNAIWTPEYNGKFSIASAWEVIRKKRVKDPINTIIWHKHIPFKVSFFIWRALRNKLPTNENLQKLGRNEVECYCCHKKGTDDINHILITGHFAKYIWHYDAAKLGALYNQTDLRSLLLCWINQPRQNEVYKLLNYILPNFVCWNLWKNRCAVKYGGKKSSVHRVIYGIFKDTMQVVKMVYPNIP